VYGVIMANGDCYCVVTEVSVVMSNDENSGMDKEYFLRFYTR
jgi:hypothetical protein